MARGKVECYVVEMLSSHAVWVREKNRGVGESNGWGGGGK